MKAKVPRRWPSPGMVVVTLVLLVGAIVTAVPYLYLAFSAFKPQEEIFGIPITFLPAAPTLDNMRSLFETLPYARWYVNTTIVAVAGTALTVFISSLAGFAFAKYDFRFKNVLFTMVLATVLIPFQVLVVPQFQIIQVLGGFNTYWALILPVAANAFGIFLMRQYTISVPDELIDAARVDGASEFGIWWRIVVPLVRGGLAVVGLISFLAYWNEFFWPLIVTTEPSMFVVNLGIASLIGPYDAQYGMLLSGALLASLPLIVAFIFFQRQIMEGLTAGAIK